MSASGRAGREHQRRVARVEVRRVRDLVGHHRAADARVVGPAVHSGLEERSVDDELRAPVEQVDQALLAVGRVEAVLLVDREPRHPPPLGRERVARPHDLLLLHAELGACGVPLLRPTRSGASASSLPWWCPLSRRGRGPGGVSSSSFCFQPSSKPARSACGRIAPAVVTHAQARAVGLGGELERHLGVAEHPGPPAAQEARLVDLEHLALDGADLGGAGLERELVADLGRRSRWA